MFAPSYFPSSYFAPRYFPAGGVPAPIPIVGVARTVEVSVAYKPSTRTLLVRAWIQDEHLSTLDLVITASRCRCIILDESARIILRASGEVDPAGAGEYIFFEFPSVQLAVQHDYVMEITIETTDNPIVRTWGRFPLPTVN